MHCSCKKNNLTFVSLKELFVMRICIDIQSTIGKIAGVGRYTKMLVDALLKNNQGNEIVLFYFDFMRKGSPFTGAINASYRENAVRWLPGRVVQKLWKTIYFPPFNWFSGRADVYHFPNFIIPPISCGKKVVSIHDTSFIRYPQFTERKNLKYLHNNIRHTLIKADAIITISHFSADELKAIFPESANKVYVIYPGTDHFQNIPSKEKIEKVCSKYKISKPYLLNVGTLEPRKNQMLLVDIIEKMSDDFQLVIAGMRGWKYERILEKIYNSKSKAKIIYLEYVPEDELKALYAGASLFVFPSLYEGFGFPPLEAMAYSLPVVAAKCGSLPEVLGNAAFFVDNTDTADVWVEAIEGLLQNEQQKQVFIQRGLERVKIFKWEQTANETLKVYQEVAK